MIEINQTAARQLARKTSRNQHGWVEAFGTRVKKWKGHYFVYVRQTDGGEKRVHKSVDLGARAAITKADAEDALRRIIREKASEPVASEAHTLQWFWEKRYRPMKEPTWKESARSRMVGIIENYVMKPFGAVPLEQLGRFAIQDHLNKMALTFSGSIVQKFRTWMKAILEEAVEQDLLVKNPARKLQMPRTRKSNTRVLSPEEIARIMDALFLRDRLIVRMFLVLGLRPGELFALRRDDYTPGAIRIDESISPDQILGDPKTEGSQASVWLPLRIEAELVCWMDAQRDRDPRAFLFPTKNGTPLNVSNFLNQILTPACDRALAKMRAAEEKIPEGFLAGVNHQAFRRTCATRMQAAGTVKDVQAHLRHSNPNMTARVYMQSIPESVKAAVNHLDEALFAPVEKAATAHA
jgi:integrase